MPKPTTLILASLWFTLGSLPVNAHHSYAQFDQKICKTLEGTVRKWEFTYPHTWLWVTAKGPDDTDVLYGFEGSDPASIAVFGWTPELFFTGDKVTVNYNPLRDGRNGGSIRSVVLPNGKKMEGLGSETDTFWADQCTTFNPDERNESA